MGRIAWAKAPSLRVAISLPDPPSLPRLEGRPDEQLQKIADWMQRAHEWMQRSVATANLLADERYEVHAYLSDVLDVIKHINRDGLDAVAAVSGTADATYSANEVTLINNLVTAVEALRTNVQE